MLEVGRLLFEGNELVDASFLILCFEDSANARFHDSFNTGSRALGMNSAWVTLIQQLERNESNLCNAIRKVQKKREEKSDNNCSYKSTSVLANAFLWAQKFPRTCLQRRGEHLAVAQNTACYLASLRLAFSALPLRSLDISPSYPLPPYLLSRSSLSSAAFSATSPTFLAAQRARPSAFTDVLFDLPSRALLRTPPTWPYSS